MPFPIKFLWYSNAYNILIAKGKVSRSASKGKKSAPKAKATKRVSKKAKTAGGAKKAKRSTSKKGARKSAGKRKAKWEFKCTDIPYSSLFHKSFKKTNYYYL